MADGATTKSGFTPDDLPDDPAELKRMLKSIIGAQSGSDRKVAEVTKERDELSYQLGRLQDSQSAATLEARENQLRVRERLMDLGAERSIPTGVLRWIKAKDEDEATIAVDQVAQALEAKRAEAARRYDREHGRVVDGPRKAAQTGWQSLLAMSDEQLKQLGPQAISAIADREARRN